MEKGLKMILFKFSGKNEPSSPVRQMQTPKAKEEARAKWSTQIDIMVTEGLCDIMLKISLIMLFHSPI